MNINLQVIYRNNKPHGIRNENGYLLFFPQITKYEGQEKRYSEELEQQCRLARYLLKALKEQANVGVVG